MDPWGKPKEKIKTAKAVGRLILPRNVRKKVSATVDLGPNAKRTKYIFFKHHVDGIKI